MDPDGRLSTDAEPWMEIVRWREPGSFVEQARFCLPVAPLKRLCLPMRSSNEMYERGVLDAEQDDLNLFYYQHYYHYRRGYDSARKRVVRAAAGYGGTIRRVGALLAGALLLVALAGVLLQWPGGFRFFTEPSEQVAARAPTPTRVIHRAPTATPIVSATLTITPTPTPIPTLQIGGQARVINVGDVALVGRDGPSIGQPAQAAFPAGAQVTILAGPVDADGYVWWQIEDASGRGWSAEHSADGVVWLEPLPPLP